MNVCVEKQEYYQIFLKKVLSGHLEFLTKQCVEIYLVMNLLTPICSLKFT